MTRTPPVSLLYSGICSGLRLLVSVNGLGSHSSGEPGQAICRAYHMATLAGSSLHPFPRSDPREFLRWRMSKKTMLAVRVPGINERMIYLKFISLPPASARRRSPAETPAVRMWLLYRELLCAGGLLGILEHVFLA